MRCTENQRVLTSCAATMSGWHESSDPAQRRQGVTDEPAGLPRWRPFSLRARQPPSHNADLVASKRWRSRWRKRRVPFPKGSTPSRRSSPSTTPRRRSTGTRRRSARKKWVAPSGPDGKIMHAELRIGDSRIMVNDAMMGGKGPEGDRRLAGVALDLRGGLRRAVQPRRRGGRAGVRRPHGPDGGSVLGRSLRRRHRPARLPLDDRDAQGRSHAQGTGAAAGRSS